MLKSKQKIVNNITYFHLPEQAKDGSWKVKCTRNGHCIKMTYALNEDQANQIRTIWINQFWGNQLN